ncbi:MAG: hypothetical protein UCI02_06300 [Bifidobacterium criceti]|nr:hypothetical protein [Bifidobacterium criceti]
MAQDMTTFAKLSAKLYLNVKVRSFAAEHAQAAFLWVLAITYAVDRKSDGYVEDFAMRTFLGGTDDDITALQEAGFIEPAEGGWMIHDFLKSQISSGEQEDLRAKRAAAGRKGGRKSGESRATQANTKQNEAETLTTEDEVKQERSKIEASAQANTKQNEAETDIETDIPPYSPPTGTGSDDSPNHDDPDDDGFDAAWDAYPKHTGSKTKTRRVWQRTLADTDAGRLRASVDAYAAHTAANRDDARWTPTMANWLERGQWRDWPPKPKDVPLPSDYWFANNFDARLLDAGIDYLTVMRLHPDVNQRIRDGDDWQTAADTVIGQTLDNAIQTREEQA